MENYGYCWPEFGNSVDVVERYAPEWGIFGHGCEYYAVVVELQAVLVNDVVAEQIEMPTVEAGRFTAETPVK